MISSVGDTEHSSFPLQDLPMVIIYPEAVVYGPVTVNDVPILVEEHLSKGHIVKSLLGRNARTGG